MKHPHLGGCRGLAVLKVHAEIEWRSFNTAAGVGYGCGMYYLLIAFPRVLRENIEKDIEVEKRRADNPDVMEEDVDLVPCITRAHFEEVGSGRSGGLG